MPLLCCSPRLPRTGGTEVEKGDDPFGGLLIVPPWPAQSLEENASDCILRLQEKLQRLLLVLVDLLLLRPNPPLASPKGPWAR